MGAVFFAAIVFAGFLAALRAAGFVPAAFFFAGFATLTRFLVACFREADFVADPDETIFRFAALSLCAVAFRVGAVAFDLDADLPGFDVDRVR